MKSRLLSLLSGARHHVKTAIVLPVPFASLVHVPASDGPMALLDRAVAGSGYANFACAVVAPRFTFVAERQPAPAEDRVRMPWDDDLRKPTRVTRARRTLRFEGESSVDEGCPFALAEELLDAAGGSVEASDVPFLSGFVGYFGYGAGAFVETLVADSRPRESSPDVALLFADAVLFTHDANARHATLSVVGRGATSSLAARDAEALVARVEAIVGNLVVPPPPRAIQEARVLSSYSARTYAELVTRAKRHVIAGDVFQLCLTHRVDVSPPPSPAHLYDALRAKNPAPFASFLRFDDETDLTIVSSSPERFLRLSSSGVAEARPIKGTRPRGATEAEDEALARDLSTSEKDGAENDMIVDLLRNDLSKVSVPGSVEVRERRVVERHPSVLQLVSTIVSQLAPGHGPFDLLRAAFPGGSMTGAPKVRAMELLAELEPRERGVYSGALGYVDVRGTLDTAIVIRTFIFAGGTCTFGIGGGIVLDSDPLAEWRETLDKARALVDALGVVIGGSVTWKFPDEAP